MCCTRHLCALRIEMNKTILFSCARSKSLAGKWFQEKERHERRASRSERNASAEWMEKRFGKYNANSAETIAEVHTAENVLSDAGRGFFLCIQSHAMSESNGTRGLSNNWKAQADEKGWKCSEGEIGIELNNWFQRKMELSARRRRQGKRNEISIMTIQRSYRDYLIENLYSNWNWKRANDPVRLSLCCRRWLLERIGSENWSAMKYLWSTVAGKWQGAFERWNLIKSKLNFRIRVNSGGLLDAFGYENCESSELCVHWADISWLRACIARWLGAWLRI